MGIRSKAMSTVRFPCWVSPLGLLDEQLDRLDLLVGGGHDPRVALRVGEQDPGCVRGL
ncbi:MAG: hypothetical protein ACRDRK_21820 [Pseudonocardia sp.]